MQRLSDECGQHSRVYRLPMQFISSHANQKASVLYEALARRTRTVIASTKTRARKAGFKMICGLTVEQVLLLRRFYELATGRSAYSIGAVDVEKQDAKQQDAQLMPLYELGQDKPVGYVRVSKP